jgi:hypothetical protein
MRMTTDKGALFQDLDKGPPNTACTGRWGFSGTYGKHVSGFEFSLLPNRVHARPSASNASRWALRLIKLADV